MDKKMRGALALVGLMASFLSGCDRQVSFKAGSLPGSLSGSWSALAIASGGLSANPATCILDPTTALCSSSLTWSTQGAGNVRVTVNGELFAAAASGGVSVPWIGATPLKFELWGDGVVLSSVTVVGIPRPAAEGSISAAPASCTLDPVTGLCSTTVSWTTTQAHDVKVTANGSLFAAAISGSALAPWIGAAPVKFELWADGALLDSVSVVGMEPVIAVGSLTASPTSCTLNPATGLCSVAISWSTSNARDVKVTVDGSLFTAAPSGTANAPWIGRTPVLFELWADGRRIRSLSVAGVMPTPMPTPTPISTPIPTPIPTPTPTSSPAPTELPSVSGQLPVIMDANDCLATDADTLRACAQGLASHQYAGIAILNDIQCNGARACHIHLDHFTGPARIYGYRPDGGNVAIHRNDHFDYPIIEIVASSGIEVRNLEFREGGLNRPAGLFGTSGYRHNLSSPGYDTGIPGESLGASSTITIIQGSSDVFIDRIAVHEAKLFGMEIGNCDRVTVRNSLFEHSWGNGIWVTNGLSTVLENDHAPVDLRIENNVFRDNRCVSIGLSAQGESWVSGNVMKHNHMGSIWSAPGGQFSIEATTRSLLVVDNEIADGSIDEDPALAAMGWLTVGIEMTDSNVRGVTIDHNFIHGNTGGGIIHDPNSTGIRADFGPIRVTNNVIDNPWIALNNFDPGELVDTNNCLGASCRFVKSTGRIAASAQTCSVERGRDLCSLTLGWTSAPARGGASIRVVRGDGVTLSTGEVLGSLTVQLVRGRQRYDLYDGATLLDSIHLGAN